MRFLKSSIIAKLWFIMVILVLMVIWVSGLAQSNIIRKIYYDQQVEQLSNQGKDIAVLIGPGSDIKENIKLLSDMTHTNIMFVDPEGFLEECHGMGMNMSLGEGINDRVSILGHHGNLMTREELGRVLSGETVAYRGPNHFVDTDVLSVAVPVKSQGLVTGAVIISAPLTPYEDRLADYQRVILNVGIGGIILATFLSLLLSRSLSRPLIQMNNVARGLAAGDFSRKVEVKTRDEIGVLASSLNTLSGQLQDKIQALERLDNTRKDFVASISHELKTPLTIMQGYAEALQDNLAETEEERQEHISCIIDEIQRLKRLVAELLDLRRIEMGQEIIELKQMDIVPVLMKSIDKMKTVALEKGITLEGKLPASIPYVELNPDRLEQVMINLLDNAIRHTPPGGIVKVDVSGAGKFIEIRVADSGPGIPESELELIWEKFYKVDKSRTRNGGGTGLGLAIVKRLIENMCGTVTVSSTEGKGTTFVISFPFE